MILLQKMRTFQSSFTNGFKKVQETKFCVVKKSLSGETHRNPNQIPKEVPDARKLKTTARAGENLHPADPGPAGDPPLP